MADRRLFRAGRSVAKLDARRGGDRRFVAGLRVGQPTSAPLIGAARRRGRKKTNETAAAPGAMGSAAKRRGTRRERGAIRLGPRGWA